MVGCDRRGSASQLCESFLLPLPPSPLIRLLTPTASQHLCRTRCRQLLQTFPPTVLSHRSPIKQVISPTPTPLCRFNLLPLGPGREGEAGGSIVESGVLDIILLWMFALRQIGRVALQMQRQSAAQFSKDAWKDRDDAAEKVYISQAEKETIKKLLKKVEAEEDDRESNLEEFERKLHQVMKRYKLDNTALASEIINLHKDLTK